MATVLLRTLGKHLLTCIVLQRLLYNTVTLGLYNENREDNNENNSNPLERLLAELQRLHY
jgi:hypothetical protein